MADSGRSMQQQADKAKKESDRMADLNARMKEKLTRYQELYDHNQRMIVLGNKLNAIAEKYFQDNKKRPLISNVLQLVEGENAKRKRKSASVAKKEREDKKKLQAEMEKAIAPIRKAKKKAKKVPPPPPPKPKVNFKCGDRVRIKDSRSVGSIDTIEKNKVIVNYGLFTTQVSVDQLELVQ